MTVSPTATFQGTDKNPPVAKMLFKRMDTVTSDHGWQSYTKIAGTATIANASLLRPRPIWRGGKTGSAKGGLLALSAIDHATGDATLNLFGLQKCHDRTCDHPVYSWADPSTSLKPFGNNPMLGGGARAAYGAPEALPSGSGGIGDLEMFQGPDGVIHAVGCAQSKEEQQEPKCFHYVNGGKEEAGATPGVQWYGPIGTTTGPAAAFPTIEWLSGAVPVIEGEVGGGYPGATASGGSSGIGHTPETVPRCFLHAAGGEIRVVAVSWEPVPGYEMPGGFDPRHVHLAIAQPDQDREAAPAAAAAADLVSVVVMWATTNDTTSTAVQLTKGNATGGGSGATTVTTGSSYEFMMEKPRTSPTGHHPPPPASPVVFEHVVTLPDLEPGAVYSYRPGAGPDGSDWHQGWTQFRAPLAAGSTASATGFIVLADMGADEANAGQTMAAIEAELLHPQVPNHRNTSGGSGSGGRHDEKLQLQQGGESSYYYSALIHAGDLAYNLDTDEGRVGDRFMDQIEPVASRVPYMVRLRHLSSAPYPFTPHS